MCGGSGLQEGCVQEETFVPRYNEAVCLETMKTFEREESENTKSLRDTSFYLKLILVSDICSLVSS